MTTTATTPVHHPSCPVRHHQHTVACPTKMVHRTNQPGPWTDVSTVEMDCHPVCLCGPEAEAEDRLILMERSPDQMLLDIVGHADQAASDFMARRR